MWNYSITVFITCTGIFLCCTVIRYVSAVDKTFTINDKPTGPIPALTTATEVDHQYRYPCYTSVRVSRSPLDRSPVGGAKVTAVAYDRTGDHFEYVGYSTSLTDVNGMACLLTLCRKSAAIFVEVGRERLYALQNQPNMPPGYTFTMQSRNEEIAFTVRRWGTVHGKTGPVYNIHHETPCTTGSSGFHFDFAFLGVQETLTAVEPDTHNQLLSWEYAYPQDIVHKICLIKVQMSVDSYQAVITLNSSTTDGGQSYGMFTSGPKESPTSTKTTVKAACLEFRCPTSDNDNLKHTLLTGQIAVPKLPKGCPVQISTELKTEYTSITASETGFTFIADADTEYGPKFGIYSDSKRDVARSMCYSGSNSKMEGYTIEPALGVALSYNCLTGSTPGLVG